MDRCISKRYSILSPEKQAHLLNLPYHLTRSKNISRLKHVLSDVYFLQNKISKMGPQPVIEDYEYCFHFYAENESGIEISFLQELKIICDTIKLSASALEEDHNLFSSQLCGRLLGRKENTIQTLLQRIIKMEEYNIWMRPISHSLIPPYDQYVRMFTMHEDKVDHVIMTKDGNIVLSHDVSGCMRVWNTHTCIQMWFVRDERQLALTHDQAHVITLSYMKAIKIRDIMTGKLLNEYAYRTVGINAIDLDPSGHLLVLACKDNTVKIFDLQKEKTIRILKGHKDEVNCVAVSTDGKLILSGSSGEKKNMLKLWDFESGLQVHDLKGHDYNISSVAISKNGHYAVSGSWDKKVAIWSTKTGEKLNMLQGHKDFITSIAIAQDSKIFSSSWDNTIKVWDLQTGNELYTLKGHSNWVNSVAVTNDGEYAVSGSSDHTVKIWMLK
jgi:WD40 repeat protein